MSLSIRTLRESDYDRWLELWNGYLTFYEVERLDPAVTEQNWQLILGGEGPIHGRMAVDGNDYPVGLVHYILHPVTWGLGPACYLEDLFVDETVRGTGAGRLMIDHLVEKAKENGWCRLYWLTHKDNATARRLYDRYTSANDFVQYRLSFD